MKKLLLFALALSVTAWGFSQNFTKLSSIRASEGKAQKVTITGMEDLSISLPIKGNKSIVSTDETEIGQTYYDWQSNAGPIHRTVTWPDGTLNACWTGALTESLTDRGTMVTYFDGNNWTVANERIEDVKTGFGSIAKYGENGLVVVAHTSTTIYVSTTDDHTLQGTWTYHEFSPESGSAWPSVITSGENNEIIHVLASPGTGKGYYYRSKDGGATWDIMDMELPYFLPPYMSNTNSNEFTWMDTRDDNRIAFVLSTGWSNGMVIYSDDNGDSWNNMDFFTHPGVNGNYPDMFVFYPRYVSADWDDDGYIHLAAEINGTTDSVGSGSYYPGLGVISYWNENDYEPWDTTYLSAVLNGLYYYSTGSWPMEPSTIGYLQPLDEEGNTIYPPTETDHFFTGMDLQNHGKYNNGPVSMPAFFVEGSRMFCIYAASHETDVNTDNGLNYTRLFGTMSNDYGETWTYPQIITTGFLHSADEYAYPYVFNTVGTNAEGVEVIRGFVQVDGHPGSYTIGGGEDGVYDDNFMKAFAVKVSDFDGIEDNSNIVNEMAAISVYPNPTSSVMNLYLEKTAQISIYNALGQQVMSLNHFGNGTQSFDISSLSDGIYIVKAKCGNATSTTKLIVK